MGVIRGLRRGANLQNLRILGGAGVGLLRPRGVVSISSSICFSIIGDHVP